jgi:hypothetical protein
VISDGVFTTLRLLAADAPMAIFFPIFSSASEIACVGVLIALIRDLGRRTTPTAALQTT